MSYLFTAVSAEQQEMVAGGRRGRRPIVVVEAPKTTTITNVVIQGNLNLSRAGNPYQSNESKIFNYVG